MSIECMTAVPYGFSRPLCCRLQWRMSSVAPPWGINSLSDVYMVVLAQCHYVRKQGALFPQRCVHRPHRSFLHYGKTVITIFPQDCRSSVLLLHVDYTSRSSKSMYSLVYARSTCETSTFSAPDVGCAVQFAVSVSKSCSDGPTSPLSSLYHLICLYFDWCAAFKNMPLWCSDRVKKKIHPLFIQLRYEYWKVVVVWMFH